jgi:ribosomal protein L40E
MSIVRKIPSTMICKRCGNDLSENASICPVCGTASDRPKASAQQPTSYGPFPQHDLGAPLSDQDSGPHFVPPFSTGRSQLPPYSAQQAAPGYLPPHYRTRPGYIPPHASPPPSFRNDTALVAEIILSLFGLFGVGWLIAGSTAVGVILLVCSVFIYWPLMIGGVMITRGFGLLCLGPIAILAIILNILFLSISLRRKATRFTVTPPPPPPPAEGHGPYL